MSNQLVRLVYERRHCVFYAYCEKQGVGEADDHIRVYVSWSEIPHSYRKIVVKSPWRNVMFYRLLMRSAKLLCYVGEDHNIKAYGWIQDWKPFRRRFHTLAENGIMLGPYWTSQESRGLGIYGLLLRHSLYLCAKDKPILIYTSSENLASRRGIEKAGFRALGEWMYRQWLVLFTSLRKVDGVMNL